MRDAEVAPEDSRDGKRKVSPRFPPDVWLREGGRWRRGWAHAWWLGADDRPAVGWVFRDVGAINSQPVLVVWDDEAIRPRDGDEPPSG